METKLERRNPFGRKVSFPLGQLVATPGALKALDDAELLSMVSRHARGDWGELSDADWNENELALKEGFRLLSAYTAKSGARIWVITEADRSATTALLPEEY